MAKNRIEDLRDHIFAQLERMSDPELTDEQLKTEIERGKAIGDLGKVIVESAKTEVLFMKLTGNLSENNKPVFLRERPDPIKLSRPPAEYSNSGHINVIKKLELEKDGTGR